MNTTTVLSPRLYFSYSQFMVYDRSVELPGCKWTGKHTRQGFARRESTVCFNTPLECGHANVSVSRSAYQPRPEYSRVIAVPFLVRSGRVVVDGPEETDVERTVALPPGNYRLVAAQRVIGQEEEAIDLFFESVTEPLRGSDVIIADDALDPPAALIEIADIAGEA